MGFDKKFSPVRRERYHSKRCDGHLDGAKIAYSQSFKNAAIELDPESDQIIEKAFSDIEQNLQVGNIKQASLDRQIVDKAIYKIAFLKIVQALDNNDANKLFDWFSVMEKKFKISEKPNFVTNQALIEIQGSADEIPEYSDVIKEELLSIFKLKTIEELEEAIAALEANNESDAIKFTYECLYYYRTLHPSVVAKLGQETANELPHEIKEHYRMGHSDIALKLATSAYLDHYEFIEADIAYHNKELMEKIEIAMREDLRKMIKDGASPALVDSHIDMIIEDLEIA